MSGPTMNVLMVRILEHSVLPLSPKELLEGLLLWAFGVAVGAKLTRHHVVRPMRQHFERSHEHRAWEAQVLHDMHVQQTGERPAPHPHFDLAT